MYKKINCLFYRVQKRAFDLVQPPKKLHRLLQIFPGRTSTTKMKSYSHFKKRF